MPIADRPGKCFRSLSMGNSNTQFSCKIMFILILSGPITRNRVPTIKRIIAKRKKVEGGGVRPSRETPGMYNINLFIPSSEYLLRINSHMYWTYIPPPSPQSTALMVTEYLPHRPHTTTSFRLYRFHKIGTKDTLFGPLLLGKSDSVQIRDCWNHQNAYQTQIIY